MSLGLSEIGNNKQKKEFIKLLDEINQHLIVIGDRNGFQQTNYEMLIEIGIINNISEVDELSLFIDRKCGFTSVEIYRNI